MFSSPGETREHTNDRRVYVAARIIHIREMCTQTKPDDFPKERHPLWRKPQTRTLPLVPNNKPEIEHKVKKRQSKRKSLCRQLFPEIPEPIPETIKRAVADIETRRRHEDEKRGPVSDFFGYAKQQTASFPNLYPHKTKRKKRVRKPPRNLAVRTIRSNPQIFS
mmetsp:Transcript_22629/g.36044  ORF Transcript_22629/g.36044 Transcript_22629/m.36044 type:complete len:164 (-) Transcript_22629:5017-5508(-)